MRLFLLSSNTIDILCLVYYSFCSKNLNKLIIKYQSYPKSKKSTHSDKIYAFVSNYHFTIGNVRPKTGIWADLKYVNHQICESRGFEGRKHPTVAFLGETGGNYGNYAKALHALPYHG